MNPPKPDQSREIIIELLELLKRSRRPQQGNWRAEREFSLRVQSAQERAEEHLNPTDEL